MKQQIPEAVLWRPSREYLRRKSRDKKHQVNSPVSLASRLYKYDHYVLWIYDYTILCDFFLSI
jgi:hypothetical protein